jgi:hypothetical protein
MILNAAMIVLPAVPSGPRTSGRRRLTSDTSAPRITIQIKIVLMKSRVMHVITIPRDDASGHALPPRVAPAPVRATRARAIHGRRAAPSQARIPIQLESASSSPRARPTGRLSAKDLRIAGSGFGLPSHFHPSFTHGVMAERPGIAILSTTRQASRCCRPPLR